VLEQRQERINYLLEIITADLNNRFQSVNNIFGTGNTNLQKEYTEQILDDWLSFFRDIFLVKNRSSSHIINIPFKGRIQLLAQKYPNTRIIKILKEISLFKRLLSQSINPRLVLENLALKI